MILVLNPNVEIESNSYQQLMAQLARLPDIQVRVHREVGAEQTLTEVYLIGNTSAIAVDDMRALPAVERVVRVSEEYRVLGRHKDDDRPSHFEYQGLRFGQDTLCICRIVRRRHKRISRDDDESSRAVRTSVHAHGRLQTADESLFVSGLWKGVPAVCF